MRAANDVSAVVIQGFFSAAGSAAGSGRILQRKASVQLRPGMDAFPVDLRPKSGGWPLPRDVQEKMEKAMGANFSDIRIHVGTEATSIGAIAFTWGSDIHFAPGQYNPHTPHGQFLLGHELAHVVQQRAGRVANPFGSGVAVVQDHALEAEADRLGRMAAAARSAPANPADTQAVGTNQAIGSNPRLGPAVISQKSARVPAYALRPAVRTPSGWEIQVAAGGRQEPVGSVHLTPSGKGVYLSDLRISPEHRRHGLATQLVQAAMRTARSQGYPVTHLEARPSPGAGLPPSALVSMYYKLGFRTTGLSPRGSPLMEWRSPGTPLGKVARSPLARRPG
jgi:ribosomal protein S18 acetylase RimI-like enzyme